MSKDTGIKEGWPPDPGEDELERFAEQVQAAVPQLPPSATARIHARLQAALKRRPGWGRRVAWLSAAAAILLAVSAGIYFMRQHGQPLPPPNLLLVFDTIKVSGAPPAVEKPLLQIDKYQSLFTN